MLDYIRAIYVILCPYSGRTTFDKKIEASEFILIERCIRARGWTQQHIVVCLTDNLQTNHCKRKYGLLSTSLFNYPLPTNFQ